MGELTLATRMGHCFSLVINDGVCTLANPEGVCFEPPHNTHLKLVYIPARKKRGMLGEHYVWVEEIVSVPELWHLKHRDMSRKHAPSFERVPWFEYTGAIFKIVPEETSRSLKPYTKPREMFMGMHVDTPEALQRHRQAIRDEKLITHLVWYSALGIVGVLLFFQWL